MFRLATAIGPFVQWSNIDGHMVNVSMSVAGPGAQPSGGGFFAHHGAGAPGVRLFRALNFRTKALITSTVLLLPTALLAWDFLSAKAEAIGFSAKERGGVAYLRDALPIVKLGQQYRLHALQAQAEGGPTPELAEARKALDAQLAKLDIAETPLRTELGTAKALAAVKAAAHAAAVAGGDKTVDAHTAHIAAVLALVGQATDGSNLTLDPDMDTYYLMDGALGALPSFVESTAKLRGTSAAVAASGQPASENVQRIITGSAVGTELFEGRVTAAFDKIFSVHPEYRAEFKADDLVPQLRAFRELALGGKSDAAALIAKGTAQVNAMIALQTRMMERLDELLKVRVDAIEAQRNLTMLAVGFALLISGYLFCAFYLVTQGGLNEVKRRLVAPSGGDDGWR